MTVERAALAVHLVKEARRLYPAIRFQFDTTVQVYGLTGTRPCDNANEC